MTTTELDGQVTGGSTPDGGCTVVDRHGARIGQPAMVVPEAMEALQGVATAVVATGLPQRTIDLVNVRVRLIDSCGVCLLGDIHIATRHGETDERAALALQIANINVWNRLNVATRQVGPARWVVLVHAGDGKGKSSSAFGVMLRAVAPGVEGRRRPVHRVRPVERRRGEDRPTARGRLVDDRRRLRLGQRRPHARHRTQRSRRRGRTHAT